MKGAAAAVAGLAIVAGVALGVLVTSNPGTSIAAGSSPAAGPSATSGPSTTAPRSPLRADSCVDAAALVRAYAARGDARSVVVPGSVRCAGPYAVAVVRDPSLPDQLNALFSVSPVRALGATTGPVCHVGTGRGGLPPVTAAQGAVLNCA